MKKIIIILLFVPFLLKSQDAFISGNDTICDNEGDAEVKVDFNGTAPFTFVYAINGITQLPPIETPDNPHFILSSQEGNYSLVSYSDITSAGTVSGNAMITVNEAPTAVISNITDTIKSLHPSLPFTSNSVGNIKFQIWNYGYDALFDTIDNPIHTFPLDSQGLGIPATYTVTLIVIDDNNCKNNTSKNIFIENDYWMYLPNSFTPDNDNINDKFCIEYYGIREETFSFYIFDKNGGVIFQTNDSRSLKCSENGGWDGKGTDGNYIIPGTYVYESNFQEWDGWKNNKYGTIRIIR